MVSGDVSGASLMVLAGVRGASVMVNLNVSSCSCTTLRYCSPRCHLVGKIGTYGRLYLTSMILNKSSYVRHKVDLL